MPQVTVIPASRKSILKSDGSSKIRKRRVAAYARVSTDKDEQLTSYERQVSYYEQYVKSRSDWEFVKVYTDEGITGTNTKNRVGFNSMVADALAGKIDLIVAKSVSRFARNTVDSISTIRKLKEQKVEVFFEKENIWTFDGKGELLITIMSSLAQEESRSISENCTWGKRKCFAEGKVWVPFSGFLGYDRGPNGELVVNPEQAKIVRKIFDLYLKGFLPTQIAKALTKEGIPTVYGKKEWKPTVIFRILKNEKYRGDALLQKSYVTDFITKKSKINHGEIPQYYVEGNHEAIVDPEVFDQVQAMIKRRGGSHRYSDHCFSGVVVCGECGSGYSPYVWHPTDKYRKRVWQCYNRYTGTKSCKTKHVDEKRLEAIFVEEMNKLIRKKKSVILESKKRGYIQPQLDELDAELDRLNEDLNKRSAELDRLLQKSSKGAPQDTERYIALCEEYEKIQIEYNQIKDKRTDISMERYAGRKFRNYLADAKSLKEFDDDLWRTYVKRCEVYADGKIILIFTDGTQVETHK